MGKMSKKIKKNKNKRNNMKKNIGKVIQEDRQQLLMLGMITSLEILKDYFNFTDKQLKDFSDKYMPELKRQMNKHEWES